MAFKQKSGSPFLRNFGVGKSPAKQQSPMKDTKRPHQANGIEQSRADAMNAEADAAHKTAMHTDTPEGIAHQTESSGFPMKSSGFKMREGSPMKERQFDPPVKDPEGPTQPDGTSDYSYVPPKRTKDPRPTETGDDTAPLTMKSSGFKMKSSPFNRNFGIGDTPSPMKVVDAYDTKYVESMQQDYTDEHGNTPVEKKNVSTETMKEIKDIYTYQIDKSKYPTFEDYLNARRKTSEGTQSYSIERKADKDDATTVSADNFFSVNRKFQNRLASGMPVDWHKSFTGEDGLAAAKQALEKGHIEQDKYDELTAVYNEQIERDAVNMNDDAKIEKAWYKVMADNPNMHDQDAYNMVMENPEKYGITKENVDIGVTDESGSLIAEDIVPGDKEKFETELIEKRAKGIEKLMSEENLSREDAEQKILDIYYSNMERMKETGSARGN